MKLIKKLGQVFANSKVLKKEIGLVDIKDKIILEIGGGDGRLTKLLALKAKKVICIEKDKTYCKILKEKFKDNKKVLIMCGDFLKFPPRKIDLVFGNVPYCISSNILFHLKKFNFEEAVLMFQKEFVLKIVAKENTKQYGFLSVVSQFYFNINLECIVSRTLFHPKPKVDSIIITLKKTNNKLDKKVEEIIKFIFQHKKKTLKNALEDSYKKLKIPKKEVRIFTDSLKNANKRVFKLTNEEIVDISKKVYIWEKKYSLTGEKKKENY